MEQFGASNLTVRLRHMGAVSDGDAPQPVSVDLAAWLRPAFSITGSVVLTTLDLLQELKQLPQPVIVLNPLDIVAMVIPVRGLSP